MSRLRRLLLLTTSLFLLVVSTSELAWAQACASSRDCSGAQVCDAGTCRGAGSAPAPSSAAAAAPTAAPNSYCASDSDCSSGQSCLNSQCIAPVATAPTPVAVAPASPAPVAGATAGAAAPVSAEQADWQKQKRLDELQKEKEANSLGGPTALVIVGSLTTIGGIACVAAAGSDDSWDQSVDGPHPGYVFGAVFLGGGGFMVILGASMAAVRSGRRKPIIEEMNRIASSRNDDTFLARTLSVASAQLNPLVAPGLYGAGLSGTF